MASFVDVLTIFKKYEGPEVVVALIEDPILRKALIAWPSVKINYKTPMEECNDNLDDVSKWDWLWTKVGFAKDRFCVVAGLKGQELDPVLTRLKGLRLIYPDGTVNVMAQQYLRSIVAAQLSKSKPRGQAAQPAQQPKKA
jgi:hypothetical protein